MERKSLLRQRLGTFILCGTLAATPLPDSKAATQGKPGKTSSGSFSITLIVHPSLHSQVAQVDDQVLDESGNPLVIPTDTLSFDRSVSLCVAGRGLSRFSLASEGVAGVSLQVTDSNGTTSVTDQASVKFLAEPDCQQSVRRLSAVPAEGFQGSTQPATLVIHAE